MLSGWQRVVEQGWQKVDWIAALQMDPALAEGGGIGWDIIEGERIHSNQNCGISLVPVASHNSDRQVTQR